MPSEQARASDGGATAAVTQAAAPKLHEIKANFRVVAEGGITVGGERFNHGDVAAIVGDVAQVLLGQGSIEPA